MMPSHYQPLLPSPDYFTVLGYQARLMQLGNRHRAYERRKRHSGLNQYDHLDLFDSKALYAAVAALKADPRATAAVQASEIAQAKAQNKPVPVFGVHGFKLRTPGPANAERSTQLTTPDNTAPVRLGRT